MTPRYLKEMNVPVFFDVTHALQTQVVVQIQLVVATKQTQITTPVARAGMATGLAGLFL